MLIHEYKLPNGLRIIHYPTASPVVYSGFIINAGTRDEYPEEQGMAHFVEHMLFKGTTHRKAWHILNRLEAVGGELNAYTNKEETVVYNAFLPKDLSRALELLVDIVFHSTFPQKEIDKEVEVIIDEIESYLDTPSEQIFDDFEELMYPNHPLGHNILGKPELLRTFKSEDALRFVKRYYQPENMVLFLTGNVNTNRFFKLAEKLIKDIPSVPVIRETIALPKYVPCEELRQISSNQSHVMLGCPAYDSHNENRTTLYLLNNILGGPGMNSRLNVTLRERRGLVYQVESNITSYTDTGLFSIYFGTAHEDVKRCLDYTYRELDKLCQKPLSNLQLQAAKKQLIGQIGVSSDNYESIILGVAKRYLNEGSVESQSKLFERIQNLTSQQIQDVAKEILNPKHLTKLQFG